MPYGIHQAIIGVLYLRKVDALTPYTNATELSVRETDNDETDDDDDGDDDNNDEF